MSKRPYVHETVSRQMKKRITEKDINFNSEEKLKNLHEKTINILFAGARASTKGVDGNQNIEKPTKKTCSICHSVAVSTCWNCTLYLCCSCRKQCAKCTECFCNDCCKDSQEELNRTICIHCLRYF